jgi:hypothetical protein
VAIPALGGIEQDFRSGFLTLRVMAPGAGKRAAFEKNGGPDARPVVEGVALQIGD